MAGDDFKLNYKGMAEYLVSEEMSKMVRERGEVVMTVAEATAPDYTPLGVGYKQDFVLDVGVREGKHPRACATVKNTSDHAIFVEFGGKATPRHRILGRAVGAE